MWPSSRKRSLHARVTIAILRVVEDRGLRAAAAARLFGIGQPAMRRLLRGPDNRFTIDEMVRMLARAHLKVTVRVSNGRRRVARASGSIGAAAPAKRGARPGELTSSGRKGDHPAARKRRLS
ncbi:MAG: XRE family transcriptional regulator [Candidatus Eisenbacteria bacterium]